MIPSIEQHVDWIARCLVDLRKRDATTIEPEPDAETYWVDYVNAIADLTLYPTCNSWYLGAEHSRQNPGFYAAARLPALR